MIFLFCAVKLHISNRFVKTFWHVSPYFAKVKKLASDNGFFTENVSIQLNPSVSNNHAHKYVITLPGSFKIQAQTKQLIYHYSYMHSHKSLPNVK